MKKILGIILRVYAVICMSIVTLFLITAMVVLFNFGRITAFAIEKVVDNYNIELNDIISNVFSTSITNKDIKFESIQTVAGGGLQASFSINNSAAAGIDLNNYQNKSNDEIISELGITVDDIPAEIKSLLLITKQTLVLNFKDLNGNEINRAITAEEIQKLFE